MADSEAIIVSGAGIAGLACALGLARAGFAVRLLAPRVAVQPRAPDEYDARVYALSQASRDLLAQLGVWGLLDARRITAVEAMEVYGDANGRLELSAWQVEREQMAWIVESGEMLRVLQQAVQFMGVQWLDDSFVGLASAPAGVVLQTARGERLAASLVVGADGAKSPLRQAAGIYHSYTPYGDMGVVAHLDAELAHQNRALQWFADQTVFALLPMPDTTHGAQLSLVWSMPVGRARAWLAMEPEAQQDYFQRHARAICGERVGELRLRTRPQGFELTLEHSHMVGAGVALVGDAAHRVHPLAGQGLNLGLGDVAALLQVLQAGRGLYSPGHPRLLERYRRARAEPVFSMSLVSHGLHQLFAAPGAPLAWARNQGMLLVDSCPPLKRLLVAGAAGRAPLA